MGAKIVAHDAIQTTDLPLPDHLAIRPFFLLWGDVRSNKLYIGERAIDHSKMKNESAKKSLEKSKKVLEEKRKMVKQKICIKKINTFTIIAMKFVAEKIFLHSATFHLAFSELQN